MTDIPDQPEWAHIIRVATLLPNQVEAIELVPDAPARQIIGRDLDLLSLRKLRFLGELSPLGDRGWLLKAKLGATISQACVVTGDPVPARIDVPVIRHFLPDDTEYEVGGETEMPADDSVRIELRVRATHLLAEVPHHIFDDMDLAVGKEVFLILKLRAIRVYENKVM